MNGALLTIRCLEAEGVDHVWGYPGGAIMPIYDALLESPIKHYLARHEQGASFAAQGFARTRGKPGVVMATSGPGATNLVTGVADAQMDSVPLVAITGQVPTAAIGTDAFQEADIPGIFSPIVKHIWQPHTPEEIPEAIRRAFEVAASGRPGPVLVDIPKDVQVAATDAVPMPPKVEAVASVPRACPDQIRLAQELMAKSERPIIYAGGGVRIAGVWDDLRAFADATGAPLVHTLHGLGGVPFDHPNYVGMLGMHGSKAANTAVQESDLLIVVGARFDDRVTGKLDCFAPKASVIHIDIDASELGKRRHAHAALCGTLVDGMRAIARPMACEAWKAQLSAWKSEHAHPYNAPFESIYAPKLLRDLSRRAPENTFVTCDVGQHQMWVAQHFGFRHPRQHLTSGGLGTMGFGLPTAMGVKVANPDANVICVSGDGSIMMNIQELATLNRYNIGVKVLLLDNSVLGMVRQWQELFFTGRESEIDLSDNPNFADLARVCGLEAMTIELQSECDAAIEALLTPGGPMFVHAKIDRHANVWPLVPPNTSNSEMMDQSLPSPGTASVTTAPSAAVVK